MCAGKRQVYLPERRFKGQTDVLSLPEVYMCLLREQEPVSGWLEVADSLEVSWRQGLCSSSLSVLPLLVPMTTCVCIS